MTWSWLIIPTVFGVGAVSGGLLGWHWRGRRGEAAPREPDKVWKLVAATAVLTALGLVAVGYGVIRFMIRPARASRATVEQAVADFRRTPGTGDARGAGRAPSAGVYRFSATGFYEASAPLVGKERRDLPGTVPGLLVADGDCWELTLRFFQGIHWKARYCLGPADVLRLVKVENQNQILRVKSRWDTFCEPEAVMDPAWKVGETFRTRCRTVGNRPDLGSGQPDTRAVYLGVETLTIDGRPVRAHRLRRTFDQKGLQSSAQAQDLWHAVDSRLLVQLQMKGEGRGLARFSSDYRLTVASLRPTR